MLGKLMIGEVFEAVRGQGRVADRGHDRSVAEIGLDGASVVAVVGELEPAGMPQHVGMHKECEFRNHARPGNHALISGYGQRRATLRDEDVWGGWGFALELAQRAAFPRRYRMHACIPALGPAYMQAPGGEVDVVPAQCHQLRGPETMAVTDQDSRGVPMPRAVLLGGLDEALNLPVGEIFAAALANCYIYGGWSRFVKPRVFHGNRPPACSYCYRFSRRCNRPRMDVQAQGRGFGMSAFGGRADIAWRCADVCF